MSFSFLGQSITHKAIVADFSSSSEHQKFDSIISLNEKQIEHLFTFNCVLLKDICQSISEITVTL